MGKVYGKSGNGKYYESEQLAIYISGKQNADGWRTKAQPADFFVAKGLATALFKLLGLPNGQWKSADPGQVNYTVDKKTMALGPEISLSAKKDEFVTAVSLNYTAASNTVGNAINTFGTNVTRAANNTAEYLTSCFRSGDDKRDVGNQRTSGLSKSESFVKDAKIIAPVTSIGGGVVKLGP
jgi:hypothetical protein